MNVAILCGGKGTRLAELTEGIPKGLIPVGSKPIVWHIMKYFSTFGHANFILLVGYMGQKFRDYFASIKEDWKIEFVDSGESATKCQRLRDARDLLVSDRFFLSYGDDLSDIDLDAVLATNDASGTIVTLTAVQPYNPFGSVRMADDGRIEEFREKEKSEEWINGGYMVVRPGIYDHLDKGELEDDVFPSLAKIGAIDAYRHTGFWMSMNTFKESQELCKEWNSGQAVWKKWS